MERPDISMLIHLSSISSLPPITKFDTYPTWTGAKGRVGMFSCSSTPQLGRNTSQLVHLPARVD